MRSWKLFTFNCEEIYTVVIALLVQLHCVFLLLLLLYCRKAPVVFNEMLWLLGFSILGANQAFMSVAYTENRLTGSLVCACCLLRSQRKYVKWKLHQ